MTDDLADQEENFSIGGREIVNVSAIRRWR